jgi:hypothetical protein
MAHAPARLRFPLDRLADRQWVHELPFVIIGVLGSAAVAWLAVQGNTRLALAGALVVLLGGAALTRPSMAIVATLVLLAVLGDLRRALIPVAGWISEDPLLLVAPVVASLLTLTAFVRRAIRFDTPLARCVLLVMLIMAVQIINPRQGGLRVGVAGALFTLVPLLWFWIGRTYVTPALLTVLLYRVVPVLAFAAALLGLAQVFIGFLPFEQQWIDLARSFRYGALNVGGHIRQFAFFTSAAEYVHFTALAFLVLWAGLLRPSPVGRGVAVVLMLLLAVSLVLASSRGIIVTSLAAAAGLWAIQTHSRTAFILRLTFALAIAAAGLAWTLSQAPDIDPTTRAGALLEHQIAGLSDPFDPQESTAQIHIELVVQGLVEGMRSPLGHGLGVTSLAASRFGRQGVSSEVDVSNMFIALGLAGGVVYAVTAGLVVVTAVRYWWRTRSLIALAILGVLGVTIGQWLIGGLYSVSALVWLCIGALDRFQQQNE